MNRYEKKKSANNEPKAYYTQNSCRAKSPLSQKQLITLCIAAVLLVVIAVAIIFAACGIGGKASSSLPVDSYDPGANSLDKNSLKDTLLEESGDADETYIEDTLFIGDSNTYRMMVYGFTSLDNDIGLVGMGLTEARYKPCVKFEGTGMVSIPEAVKILQPRRVVITFGTNNTIGWSTETFISEYRQFTDEIHKAYPYTDIIINSIPPISKYRQNEGITMTTIDKFNVALAEFAKEDGYKFLNTAEVLKDPQTGWAKDQYTITDGIHLTKAAFSDMFEYILKHPYISEDTRPKPLNKIPLRLETPPALVNGDPHIDYYENGWPEDQLVTVTFSVNDSTLGSLNGSATQQLGKGAPCTTVEAVPASGAVFDRWECTVGSIPNQKDPLLVFNVPEFAGETIQVTAYFAKQIGPLFKGVNDRTYEQGVEFNPMDGVSALDSDNSTAKVTFAIYRKTADFNPDTVDASKAVMPAEMTKKPGTYVIIYQATGKNGITSTASATITVTAVDQPPKFTVPNPAIIIQVETPFNPIDPSVISVTDPEDGVITLTSANYTIVDQLSGAKTELSTVLVTPGNYTITYTARDEGGHTVNTMLQLTITAKPAPKPEPEPTPPESNSPAPESNSPAPESSSPAPESSSPAPESNSPAPESNSPAPESNSPAPESSSSEVPAPAPNESTPPISSESGSETE